jgi:hypothetical protein
LIGFSRATTRHFGYYRCDQIAINCLDFHVVWRTHVFKMQDSNAAIREGLLIVPSDDLIEPEFYVMSQVQESKGFEG